MRHIYLTLSLILMFTLPSCVAKSKFLEQEKRANNLAQDKTDLTQQNKSLSDQLAAAQTQNEDLMKTLEMKKGELNSKVAELSKENQELKKEILDTKMAKEAEINKLKNTYDNLVSDLNKEIEAGAVTITQLEGKLTVNMVEKILFPSGSSTIKKEGKKVLDQVATALKKIEDKDIRIEGHTDNVPIGGALQKIYPTNWELSVARATTVARYFQDSANIEPERLIAAGFGEYRPIAPNDTSENRALNRRIEIVLVPQEPVATSVSVPDAAEEK